MRKDVILGMSIGGILLAIVVVYITIAPKTPKQPKVALDTTSTQTSPAGDSATEPHQASDVPAPSDAIHPDTHTADTHTPDTHAQDRPAPSDTHMASDAPTHPDSVVAPSNTAAPAHDTSSDPWSNALNNGVPPAPLLSTTVTPDAASGATDTAHDHDVAPAPASPTTSAPTSGGTPTAGTPSTGGVSGVPASGAPATGAPMSRDTSPSGASSSSDTPPGDSATPGAVAMVNPGDDAARVATHAAGADPAATAKGHTHVIRKGETLSSIAAAAYGSANFYPHILRANPTLNPKAMKVGQTILLPDAADVKGDDTKHEATQHGGPGAEAGPHGAPANDGTTYTVVSGDSLHRIAIKLYGKIAMVDKIYDLNKDIIGPNKANLKIGQVLKLPEKPTAER